VKARPGRNRRKTLPKERDYIRPPAVAGLFYPADKVELENTCLRFLENARAEIKTFPPKKLFGIISPHAGYPYSGYTAAHGYSMLKKGDFDIVIVVAPSHREYFDGISVFSGKAYSTPLGEIEVDGPLRDSFIATAGEVAIESRAGHKSEHAIEVQLPFLQLTLGRFTLLPIVLGDQNRRYCKMLGGAIADLISGRNVLVVASSDLSHYYDYDTANEIDDVCMTDISGLDPDKFMDDLEGRRCEACGGGPISALMYAGRKLGKTHSEILYHCNSGDSTGDKSGVVGYLSAVIS
jgi:MEMO1 family protein